MVYKEKAERFLLDQVGIEYAERKRLISFYEVIKDYYYVSVSEFGSDAILNNIHHKDVVTDTSEKYNFKENAYEQFSESLLVDYGEDFEVIEDNLKRFAYLDVVDKVSTMKKINEYVNNSELTIIDRDTNMIFHNVKLADIGTFKAYLNFEDALKDNYALDYDQVLEDDPSLEVLNDPETFEGFKEAYLVNMSKENQLSFEQRNEPVFFARVNYNFGLDLPTEHFISVNDLKGEDKGRDVLVNKVNDVLKEAYDKGSMERVFAITEVDNIPVSHKGLCNQKNDSLEMELQLDVEEMNI